jgi:octaprenyl-diphosphate synthase
MLHTATLIHDDVVDDAKTRRGLASINAVENKIAVLMGDFMLSRGLLLALENDECGFLKNYFAL